MSKISWTVFAGFQKTLWENKLTFTKKTLYTINLMHCKARPILCNPLRTNHKEMSQKCHAWQKLLKLNSKFKNLAVVGWLDTGNSLKASII